MKQIIIVFVKAALFLVICIFILQIPRWPVLTEALAGKLSAAQSALWIRLIPAFVVLLLTFLVEAFVERKQFITRFSPRPARDFLRGFFFSIILVGGTLGLLYVACDSVRLGTRNTVPEFYLWVVVAILTVVTQGYITHGYIFSLLQKHCGNAVAVAVSTLLFTLLCAGDLTGGVMTILVGFSLGLLLSLLRLNTKGLLASILIHSAWTVSGVLIFGLLPQIGDGVPGLWNTTLTGIDIFTGGAMEMGGSLITLLVLAGLIDLHLIITGDSQALRMRLRPGPGPGPGSRRKKPPDGAAEPAPEKGGEIPDPNYIPDFYTEPMPQPLPEPGGKRAPHNQYPHLSSVAGGKSPAGAAVPDSVQSRK